LTHSPTLVRSRLTTPRAAAVAGILFSLLLLISLTLVRISVPARPELAGAWLENNSGMVEIALNLLPFAGIAFLWFIGVVRDRLGPVGLSTVGPDDQCANPANQSERIKEYTTSYGS